MTDPVADMLTRIRNAMAVGRSSIDLPHSKAKEEVAKVLAASGFISSIKVEKGEKYKVLHIEINDQAEATKITSIKKLSRPGQRIYVKSNKIPKVRRGRGIVILSTSKGILEGEKARSQGLGGELICEVF